MENHIPNSTEQEDIMCLSDMEGLFLGYLVMGREMTLPQTVSKLRKQRMPSSKPMDDAAKSSYLEHILVPQMYSVP